MKPKSAPSRMLRLSATITVAFVGSVIVQPAAQAASGTWTQATSGGTWSNTNNWSGGTMADGSTSTAFFNTLDLTVDHTVHLDGSHTLNKLTFGDTVPSSAASWILDNNGTVGNVITLAGTTPTITVATGSTARVDGILTGNNVTFNGPGTLILNNANTFTGTFTMNGTGTGTTAGAVRITRADAFGSANLSWNGNPRTVLELDGSGGNINFTKNLGNTSGYILRNVAGNNTVTSGMSMYTGAGGTSVASDGGVLTLSGNIQAGQGARALELKGTSTGNNTVSGLIGAGSGTSLLKSGTGTWILTNANNTYAGTTTVQAGRLVAGADSPGSGTSGAFGNSSAGAIVLGNGSTLAGDAPALLINGAYTVGRTITVGSLSNTAAYNATIGGSNTTGTSTYTGNITLNTTAANYTATLQAATGGTVEFNTGTWTTNNKAIAIGSAGNAGMVKLSNNIATSGGINVNYGTLALNSTFTGGNLTVASGATLSGTGSISGAVTINGGILAPGNSIESLLVNGALTLNDGSTFAYEMDSSETNKSIAADFQRVFGNLALNGTVKLDLSDLAATPKAFAPNTTLTLINYVGSLSGGFFYGATPSRLNDGDTLIAGLNTWKISYGATTGGLNFATEYDHGVDSKFINLTLTAIPEPGSLLALGCLVGSGAFLRTRKSWSARRPCCC